MGEIGNAIFLPLGGAGTAAWTRRGMLTSHRMKTGADIVWERAWTAERMIFGKFGERERERKWEWKEGRFGHGSERCGHVEGCA